MNETDHIFLVIKGAQYATQAHKGQTRKSKDTPYVIHSLEVAKLASRDSTSIDVVLAAMFHDIAEESTGPEGLRDIGRDWNEHVQLLVTQLSNLDGTPKNEEMRKLVETGHNQALIIKMADMVANFREGYEDWGIDWAKRHIRRAHILLEGARERGLSATENWLDLDSIWRTLNKEAAAQ